VAALEAAHQGWPQGQGDCWDGGGLEAPWVSITLYFPFTYSLLLH
jgi:hypothetical protein